MASWSIEEYITDHMKAPSIEVVKSAVLLFEKKYSLPFIARYRTDKVGYATVDELRKTHDFYLEAKKVSELIKKTVKDANEKGTLDKFSIMQITHCKSEEAVKDIRSLMQIQSSRSPAVRAMNAGLLPAAELCLQRSTLFDPVKFKSTFYPDVRSVVNAIKEVIRHIVWSNVKIRQWAELIVKRDAMRVSVTVKSVINARRTSIGKPLTDKEKSDNVAKYRTYFGFSGVVGKLKPHQILAISRGVKHKALRRRFVEPKTWKSEYLCQAKQYYPTFNDQAKEDIVAVAIISCYEKNVRNFILNHMWSARMKNAQACSIDCFVNNLRSALLSAPVKDHVIMGIDPGFKNGCKYAIISPQGDVLNTGRFYLPNCETGQSSCNLADLLLNYKCDTLAIGNGHGSHDTEVYVRHLLRRRDLQFLNVQYRIVDESGTSQYSITKKAELELPDMEPIYRSAVSIARRMLDPLSEYIKMTPESLSLGLYQHDMPKSAMKRAFVSVVEECVSFAGIDLNTCSTNLLEYICRFMKPVYLFNHLRHVSGLDKALAKAIVNYRTKNGSFVCREQLKQIKGIGDHTFEMCSGFLRIYGESKRSNSSKWLPNPLDSTAIHPELYSLVDRLLNERKLVKNDLLKKDCRRKFYHWLEDNFQTILSKESISKASLNLVVDSMRSFDTGDVRGVAHFSTIMNDVSTIAMLRTGQSLKGTVRNVVTFGMFVDLGIECDGLIPFHSVPSYVNLRAGCEVMVRVVELEKKDKRIVLHYESMINKGPVCIVR